LKNKHTYHQIKVSKRKMSSSFTSNASKNTSNSKRILLVNNEKDVISLFKMVLEMNGFEIDAYSDPEAALSNFKPNSYGLALLDIRMAPSRWI
jgi:PleD family two-component response regulator